MKTASYSYTFEVEDDFNAGDCGACPLLREETEDYDDDGYIECDTNFYCAISSDRTKCPLTIT